MQKRMILFSGVLVSCIVQVLPAFDARNITIQINDQLVGDTVYAQPYSGFYVGKLRGEGIETLEITVSNNSAEAITITPSCIADVEPLSTATAEQGLLRIPRLANLVMAAVSLLFIVGWLAMYRWYPLVGRKRKLANIVLGLSMVGLPGAWVSGKIEDYIWTKIAENALFEPITVQPGNTAKKFVFVDKNTALPHTYVCRVVDAQGQEHAIHAEKVSIG